MIVQLDSLACSFIKKICSTSIVVSNLDDPEWHLYSHCRHECKTGSDPVYFYRPLSCSFCCSRYLWSYFIPFIIEIFVSQNNWLLRDGNCHCVRAHVDVRYTVQTAKLMIKKRAILSFISWKRTGNLGLQKAIHSFSVEIFTASIWAFWANKLDVLARPDFYQKLKASSLEWRPAKPKAR